MFPQEAAISLKAPKVAFCVVMSEGGFTKFISTTVAAPVPLFFFYWGYGREQVNRPVLSPPGMGGSTEAGWGCLARPLMKVDKPRGLVKASEQNNT